MFSSSFLFLTAVGIQLIGALPPPSVSSSSMFFFVFVFTAVGIQFIGAFPSVPECGSAFIKKNIYIH